MTIEPIVGWRAWRLRRDKGRPRLVPIGRGRSWPSLKPAKARCWKDRRHQAPDMTCTCGLYAVSDPALLRRARSPALVGTVALWGRIAEHALGWRGAFAYPQRLALVCPVCLYQRAIASSRPTVVAGYRDDSLVPLCEEHLRVARSCGSPPRDLIPARSVLTEVVESYGTDPLVFRDPGRSTTTSADRQTLAT